MSLAKTWRTARHLSASQIAARARALWRRRRYAADPAAPFREAQPSSVQQSSEQKRSPHPLAAELPDLGAAFLFPDADTMHRRIAACDRGEFTFLHRTADFSGGIRWNDPGASPLWNYQLQYLAAVPESVSCGRVDVAKRILGSWRRAFEGHWDAAAWHPYPASLRFVNLCVAA